MATGNYKTIGINHARQERCELKDAGLGRHGRYAKMNATHERSGRSRRKRKRERRLAAKAECRGDRPEAPSGETGWGVGGRFPGICDEASRSDLLLLRRAIREDWPVSPDRRLQILDEVLSPLKLHELTDREKLARAWVAIDVRKKELRVLEAIRVLEECLDTLTESRNYD